MLSRIPMQARILLVLFLPLLVGAVVMTVQAVNARKTMLIERVDQQLLTAAQCVRQMLGDDYHERIVDTSSISAEEFAATTAAFDEFCRGLRLDNIWSVMLLEGQVVYTSGTRQIRDGNRIDSVAFLQEPADPETYTEVLNSQEIQTSSFLDERGKGRLVLLPGRDGLGRPHLFVAKVGLIGFDELVQPVILRSVIICLLVFALCLGLSHVLARSIFRPLVELKVAAEKMTAGQLDQPIRISGSHELEQVADSFNQMYKSVLTQIELLQQSKRYLATTLNSIGDAVIATDAQGIITGMNPVAATLTGWNEDEARDKPLNEVFEIINSDTRQTIDNPVERVLDQGQVIGLGRHVALLDREGTERQIAENCAPMRDSSNRIIGVVLVFRDITEDWLLQEQLRQAQKMEAIGQLASGVAHDFNNLLTGIMGNAQLLTVDLHERPELLDSANQIVRAAERASDLTWQLLAFSRKGKLREVKVDLHQIIGEVFNLLQRTIDRRIKLKTAFQATDSDIVGDPTQLQNMILNLGVNARDAMPEGGTLILTTRNVELDEEFCSAQLTSIDPGLYLQLDISDTGIGMDQKTQDRIFEPFFTTKALDEGTGLGLASVYGCVKSHHGLIQVYSEVGRGATIKVLLPINRTVVPEEEDESRAAVTVRGVGHVLVVDDEEIIRNYASRALQSLGYTVTVCADGQEAVEYFRTAHDSIDLVLLDMIMPKLSGEETFQLMKEIAPDVRVVVASGFSQSQTVAKMLQDGVYGFLNKPFRTEELSQEVARFIKV